MTFNTKEKAKSPRKYNLPCHSKSIRGTSSTNPARTVMGMKESTLQVIVCMTSEYQDQYHGNDVQITCKENSKMQKMRQRILIRESYYSSNIQEIQKEIISYPVNILRIIVSITVIFS